MDPILDLLDFRLGGKSTEPPMYQVCVKSVYLHIGQDAAFPLWHLQFDRFLNAISLNLCPT